MNDCDKEVVSCSTSTWWWMCRAGVSCALNLLDDARTRKEIPEQERRKRTGHLSCQLLDLYRVLLLLVPEVEK